MAHTIKQKIAAALEARGYTRVEGRSRKFSTYRRANPTPAEIVTQMVSQIYLGKSGSCRTGDTIKGSHPIPDSTKLQLITQGHQILEGRT